MQNNHSRTPSNAQDPFITVRLSKRVIVDILIGIVLVLSLTTLSLYERYSHSPSPQRQGTNPATTSPTAPATTDAAEAPKPESAQPPSSARDRNQPLESRVDFSGPATPAPAVPDSIKDSRLPVSRRSEASAPPVPIEARSYLPETSSQPVVFSPVATTPAEDRSEIPDSELTVVSTAPSPAIPRGTGPFLLHGAGASFPNP